MREKSKKTLFGKRVVLLTFCIFDDSGVVSFHDCNARVGGAQVDANDATVQSEKPKGVLTCRKSAGIGKVSWWYFSSKGCSTCMCLVCSSQNNSGSLFNLWPLIDMVLINQN